MLKKEAAIQKVEPFKALLKLLGNMDFPIPEYDDPFYHADD